MSNEPQYDDLFEQVRTFPDVDARGRLSRLVGLDEEKARLCKMLGVLTNPQGLEAWARQHHSDGAANVLELVLRRPPLVILAGDIGTGKTELAENIGDAVARQENIDVTLLPLSLSTRGQGRVGEMTQLLSAAFRMTFDQAQKLASKSGPARGAVILLVDEADALAQSREATQMHHEDRAGVNAFIRGVDTIANTRVPAAVVMCTNRLSALDPAVRRRAAEVLVFQRPSGEQRHAVLANALKPLGLSKNDIEALVDATGNANGRSYGFTYSDLMQRLIPTVVLDAYPNDAVLPTRVLEIAQGMSPTPPFQEYEHE